MVERRVRYPGNNGSPSPAGRRATRQLAPRRAPAAPRVSAAPRGEARGGEE